MHVEGKRYFDIYTFTRANGHQALICFEITTTFGRWGNLRFGALLPNQRLQRRGTAA